MQNLYLISTFTLVTQLNNGLCWTFMEQNTMNYARTQADGLDNIAPTMLQGQQAWQYAQSDNFLSSEERAAVMRQALEPYRTQLESKLAELGYDPQHLANLPKLQADLFNGRQSDLTDVVVALGMLMQGRLRIVMTDEGPDIRITPVLKELTIPTEIAGVKLSKAEQQQLSQEGALPRPILIPENGTLVPTYLRIDESTNAVELWRVKAEQLPTKLLGIDLTKDQQLQLAGGHSVHLTGLRDNQGEAFNATVSLSAAKQSFEFSDLSRLDVALKPDNHYRQQVALNNEGAKTDVTRHQETVIGSPALSNHQRETIKNLLDSDTEPAKENSLKQRPR